MKEYNFMVFTVSMLFLIGFTVGLIGYSAGYLLHWWA